MLFLQWQVRITVSPALLLSSLSFMCSQDFNCNEDRRRRRKKKQPSTLSLLSLQRYKTSFFMVCCKNIAFLSFLSFFFKLKHAKLGLRTKSDLCDSQNKSEMEAGALHFLSHLHLQNTTSRTRLGLFYFLFDYKEIVAITVTCLVLSCLLRFTS